MKTVDHIDLRAQDALREAILKELTGSHQDHALLKEHYDRLQELTSISKKTLKRFFREKIRVGPQTRNLLAAIALGRKDDLNGISENQKDYYLIFLESLQSTGKAPGNTANEHVINPEFRKVLSTYYQTAEFQKQGGVEHTYLPLKVVKKRLERDREHFSLPASGRNYRQELTLDALLLFSHTRPLLIGEAGMGKTTFARQLCREWSSIEKLESTVPIYVNLKSPEYNRKTQGVFDYLLSRYFGQDLDWMVIEFLEKEVAGYYLLLDGFDDLSVKEKEVLMREIDDYSEDVRYLILSRPYGFHDFSYPNRSLYEMQGFGKEECLRFLSHYFDNHDIDLALPFLINYLRKHPVLSQLSKCPLHLTRIAALATADAFYSLLDKVRSEVDLLHLFNNHMADSGH
ncbi:MAG: NACHT domain-containing protein [Roseivirga sp.]|nr:NACHT domain-containing protein [Roseivirga sp.]